MTLQWSCLSHSDSSMQSNLKFGVLIFFLKRQFWIEPVQIKYSTKHGKSKRAPTGRLLGPLVGTQIFQKANLNFHHQAHISNENKSKKKNMAQDKQISVKKWPMNLLCGVRVWLSPFCLLAFCSKWAWTYYDWAGNLFFFLLWILPESFHKILLWNPSVNGYSALKVLPWNPSAKI